MRDKVACAWCREKLPLYLQGEPTEDDRARIHRHLEVCAECRDEFAGYFLLDRWGEDELPAQGIPDGFTSAVMDRLPDWQSVKADRRTHRSAVPAGKAKSFGRRAVLGNYLAAAAATLILIFTNVFGVFTDLAARADRLNAGARGLTMETQRLMEARPHWLDILKNRFQRNQQSQEGSKANAQE